MDFVIFNDGTIADGDGDFTGQALAAFVLDIPSKALNCLACC
jgi:hypothetical protein